jgi:hypothetical protein
MEERRNGDEWGKAGKGSAKELYSGKIFHEFARN